MADTKQLVGNLISTLASNIDGTGLNNRPEIAGFALGTESMDGAAKDAAATGLSSLKSLVDQTIELVLGQEEFAGATFTDAQRNAATSIAALALDPTKARQSLSKLRPVTDDASAIIVSPDSLGVEDIVDPLSLGTEAFDGEAINNALYFSITYNLMAARQDKFGEAFYPTIAIDPTVSGASIESEYISLYNEITRSSTGAADAGKFKKIPIVKAIYDNNLFATDKNKVIPVSRTSNASLLLTSEAFIDKSGSEPIQTAPMLFGKDISLLGISQTDAQLAKGVMDNTDALDRRLALEKVYFSISGTVSTVATTDMFSFDASILPHSNFTYTPQGHNKSLGLSFETSNVYVNTSSTLTTSGATSSVLGTLPANHTIVLKVSLNGKSDAQIGDITVYSNVIEVIEVRDAAGNVLPTTSADYTAIMTALTGNTKLEGYTVEAYRTNSNLRTRGQLITSDRYKEIFTVPLRSGITVLAPVNNATGDDNDAARINSQVTYAGIRTSVHAVQTLVNFADTLRNITMNGSVADAETIGVGRYHVSTYYSESNMDVSAYVDSIKSTDRISDIQAVLVNHIKNQVLTMAIDSNYLVANGVLRGAAGGKMTVIIGTDPKTAQYLTAGEDRISLGDDFDAVVVSTPNLLVRSKLFVTFGVFDGNRNTTVNPLNFGQCFWAPTITTDVVRTVNGATARELLTMPRFLHVTNLPILHVTNITGVDAALAKVTANRHNV